MSLLKAGAVQVGQSGTASQNFHWRNLLDGVLRLYRGNAEDVSPTEVMRVNANNSVAFPGGVVGGFSKEYVSPEQTITSGGALTLAHGLGEVPKLVTAEWVFTTAEHGYSVGDVVPVATFGQSTAGADGMGMSVRKNATNLVVRIGNYTAAFLLCNASTGASVLATNANGRLVMRAWA